MKIFLQSWFLAVLICSALMMPPAKSQQYMERSSVLSNIQEQKPLAVTQQATTQQYVPSLYELTKVLDDAAKTGWKPNPDESARPFPKGGWNDLDPMCSQYFREVMKQIKKRGVSVPDTYIDGNSNANKLIQAIQAAPQDWKKVDGSMAQAIANDGSIVVGTFFNTAVDKDGHTKSGHLAIVAPTPDGVKVNEICGDGPFVRDGNEHFYSFPEETDNCDKTGRHLYPSTWGTIKASIAFGSNPITWYMYRPTMGLAPPTDLQVVVG
jgi:hypothetical protein